MIPELRIEYLYEPSCRYLPKPGRNVGDVGLDIPAILDEAVTIRPGMGSFIPGGFRVQLPDGYFGMVLPRSSNNRRGLHICTGVIDNGYIGELGTEVRNISHQEITIEPGERLSQLVLFPAVRPIPIPTVSFKETDRGEQGFGSTG